MAKNKPVSKTTRTVKRATSRATKKPARGPAAARKRSTKVSVSKKDAAGALRKGAEKVKPSDLEKVLKKSNEIKKKFETGGPLGQFLDDLRLLLFILQDYWRGNYREIPYWSIAAIVAALLYVLNPLDLIPDFIPVIGYVDDALVVAACLAMVRQDLHTYKKWKLASEG